MKFVDTSQKLPIKSWCAEPEQKALEQLHNLANHPVCVQHIAAMPDCHVGMGMPIGGVIACKGAVVPGAIGVDIGCGMGFIQTNIPAQAVIESKDFDGNPLLRRLGQTIYKVIPTGFSHHKEPQTASIVDNPPENVHHIPVVMDQIQKAAYQIGTLGGGNHFAECQVDDKGQLCFMLHSGSRNVGYKIANYFQDVAMKLCEKYHSNLPIVTSKNDALPFLPVDTQEGQDYLAAMQFALEFAKQNRYLMMERIKNVLFNTLSKYANISGELVQEINIHHNFAALEHHFGQDLWIHRKGATQARKGQLGIIPGSMGTSSYIVEGLGNQDSFESCSHGAGRKMGRKEFMRRTSLEECREALDKADVFFTGWSKDRKGNVDYSEAPQAYKDIEDVIASEEDLVTPIIKLKPLLSVKG